MPLRCGLRTDDLCRLSRLAGRVAASINAEAAGRGFVTSDRRPWRSLPERAGGGTELGGPDWWMGCADAGADLAGSTTSQARVRSGRSCALEMRRERDPPRSAASAPETRRRPRGRQLTRSALESGGTSPGELRGRSCRPSLPEPRAEELRSASRCPSGGARRRRSRRGPRRPPRGWRRRRGRCRGGRRR